MLRELAPVHAISVLGYCLSSNHARLPVGTARSKDIGRLSLALAGDLDLAETLRSEVLTRNAEWTESLAVGRGECVG